MTPEPRAELGEETNLMNGTGTGKDKGKSLGEGMFQWCIRNREKTSVGQSMVGKGRLVESEFRHRAGS